MRRLRIGTVGLTLTALVGCSHYPPSAQTQAIEVARLETHVVPVVDELDVRFYLDEGPSCNAILYPPGEFRDGDHRCGSPTEAYGRFDARVRSHFDRIHAAIAASADTHRFDASFTADGVLRNVSFPREDSSWEWNWRYLYDPNHRVAKDREPGAPTYTEIDEDWWLVTEVDD